MHDRVWAYYQYMPNDNGGSIRKEITMSEQQIIEKYYNDWCERMEKAGKKDLISPENCIQDWVVVNWAYPKA